MIRRDQIILGDLQEPDTRLPDRMPKLSDREYILRRDKVLEAMKRRNYECLVIYADREHFSNFNYLTGFEPRFEEGILILKADGSASVLLGNECFSMYKSSRIPVKGILYQVLSLPGQPIDRLRDLAELLTEEGIVKGTKTGIVGWKLMHPRYGTPRMFDVPAFILEAADQAAGKENVTNATGLFVEPEYGVRILHTAEEIAWFEYGAAYASESIKQMMTHLKTGMTEMELSQYMCSGGLETNCFTLLATGERAALGLVSPTDRVIRLGDELNCSQGHRGGLTCRTGYVAYSDGDLPEGSKDYMERLAVPYFTAVVNWLEQMKLGTRAGDIYNMVQSILPKETYGWVLNPGHYVASEEWCASPFYEESDITIKSGMCIQMDIIPAMEGYPGANCEDGFAIADHKLRDEIKNRYPDVYERMEQRREVMMTQAGICLPEEVLPLSNMAGIYRPFMLNRNKALIVQR